MTYTRHPKRWLGLAIEPQAIQIAEVHRTRGRMRLTRHARFQIDDEQAWQKADDLGKRLRAFLDKHKFTARHAMVGLPGRWVLIKPMELPPANATAAAGVLRLAIERQYQAAAREWVFDYAGTPSAGAAGTVLLGATPNDKLAKVQAICQAAKLHLGTVTVTTLTLALSKPASRTDEAAVVHLAADGMQVALRAGGQVRGIQRVVAASPNEPVEHQVRRAVAAGLGDAAAEAVDDLPVIFWNDRVRNDDEDESSDIALFLDSQPARVAAVRDLGVLNGPTAGDAASGGGAAAGPGSVALALAGFDRLQAGLDFAHSRLTVKPARKITRTHVLGAAALIAVVIAAGILTRDWVEQKHAVAALVAQDAAMAKPVATAKTALDRITYARGWFDQRPPILEATRALTLAFSDQGNVWVTSLSMREDMTGTLAGEARDEKSVLALLDRLRTNARFTQVKLLYLRQARQGEGHAAFAMTFAFEKGLAIRN